MQSTIDTMMAVIKSRPLSTTYMMTTLMKDCPLSTIRTITTQAKSCQLSTICNLCLQFDDYLSEKLLSKSALAEAVRVGSQGEAVRAKILYVEPTGLLKTTSEVVRRLDSTGRSQVRSLSCNPIYLSIVKVLTKIIWSHHFCVAGEVCNVVLFY